MKFLAAHRRCVVCGAPATDVHHKKAHRGDMKLFCDRKNWEPRCKPCHDSDGRFQDRNGYSLALGSDGIPTDPNHPFNRS